MIKTGENEYCLNTHIPFKTHQQKFVPDQPSKQHTVDGRKVQNVFSFAESNKLIEKQIEPDREVVITRVFTDKILEGISTAKGIETRTESDYIEK